MTEPLLDDLALALEIADLADSITLARYRAEDLTVQTKPDLTPVTEADREVERVARTHLAAHAPGDAVLGEEFGSSGDDRSRRWIIDPIDGTMSYIRGIPSWATLLALEVDGRAELGLVSAPALGRRWWAARGHGAFVNDGVSSQRRLRVSEIRELGDAQLVYAGLEDWEGIGRLDALLELARSCWRTRGFGDIWSYMLVAEGAAEIGLDARVSLWDLAAAQVIVEEAGGRFSDLAGVESPDGGDAIVTNGHLHEAALAIIRR